jgi:putative DNA primase/helicase
MGWYTEAPSGALSALLERLVNLRRTGHNCWRATCPAHGTGRNTALSVKLEGGRILLNCFAGCEAEAVLDALGFDGWRGLYDSALWAEKPLARPDFPPPIPDHDRQAKLERLWQSAHPIQQGDVVSRYLEARGLKLEAFPSVLRFHPALDYWHDKKKLGTFPAMLARVEHPEHGIVALHRTYLTNEGSKAPVPEVKKLTSAVATGATKGAAIPLYAPTERLALAEGIETALAVHMASGWPVWSCVSVAGLSAIELPRTVREVLIAADHDGMGISVGRALAHKLAKNGLKVSMAIPPEFKQDWLDVLGKVDILEVAERIQPPRYSVQSFGSKPSFGSHLSEPNLESSGTHKTDLVHSFPRCDKGSEPNAPKLGNFGRLPWRKGGGR